MAKTPVTAAPAPDTYYVVPLRDIVMCPDMVMPVVLGRPASVRALELALLDRKIVLAVPQKAVDNEDPAPDDLFGIGCICRVLQTVRSADGTAKVLLEGQARARIAAYDTSQPSLRATVQRIEFTTLLPADGGEAVTRAALALFEEYTRKNAKLPDDIYQAISAINEPVKLFHLLAGHITVKPADRLGLLEHTDLHRAYLDLCRVLAREIELLDIENKIYGEVRQQIDDQQKSYFLHEQIKAIERELGKRNYDESSEYREKIKQAGMPEPVLKVATTELDKLEKMPPFSPEGTVIRNYLDWLVALPWTARTDDNLDLRHARRVLERSHFGLQEPKLRVLEFLAVRQLRQQQQAAARRSRGARRQARAVAHEPGTVLCLVGPPGVGKTSLARAVADALGRRFVRISLGGVRDEADIRGHRKTYVGALPGRIVQALKKGGTCNPVMLLDEIDKLASDYRGDPAAALLEVLDPEQNRAFNDHYLEVDLDLSDILFICTANVRDAIHPTLRDRMETIELSSYTEDEKVQIAARFLVEKQRALAGIPRGVQVAAPVLLAIIRDYTREAGVRQLERALAQIMRKRAHALVTKPRRAPRLAVTRADLRTYLGVRKHRLDTELPPPRPGVAVGLAWTETGGDIIKVEATVVEGKGDLLLTGQLGEVMQESARAAVTYVRKQRGTLGLEPDFFGKHDLHIHVPEGAIPKDGPSAGITVAAALYSALSGRAVRARVVMTGEITLGGAVLGVGGLKEKLLAAHRAGATTVIVPRRSEAELDEVPRAVRRALQIQQVATMDDVVACAFGAAGKKRRA
jgi:ATP-dependent Lon protease